MSLALIQESAREVRRLAIAGSPLAVGDFRLKKLVAPLEQAGVKVPVFGQVAKAIGDLVSGTEADSAAHLLSLGTLLNAILYTQGQTGVEGDSRELEAFVCNCSTTKTPARVLKPLVEALTTTGADRFEIIKAAYDRGAFDDLRLIDPAIRALGDNYPELADLVADRILPAYGPGIVPRLKEKLDIKGKKQDGRRLKIMHQLDPAGTIELCKTALEEGSPEVKTTAIACLGKHEDCLPLILEQTHSKTKALRAAALEALAEHDRPEITKLFTELIQGKALDMLAGPLRIIRNQQVLHTLLGEGKRVFDLILKGGDDQVVRYREILDCLEQRKDAETEDFLLVCFSECEKLAKVKAAKNSQITGADLVVGLASLLYNIGSPRTLEALLAERDALPPMAFGQVLHSALRLWPASRVYEEFAPLLKQKKGAGREKREELQRAIWASTSDDISEFDDFAYFDSLRTLWKMEWDPRWLDDAIEAEQESIVCCLAKPGHQPAIAYLLKLADPESQSQTSVVIHALARCQYPEVTGVFLDLVARKSRVAKVFDYDLRMLFESARHLPPTDLPKLDAFAAKLDEKFLDHYLEALGPLRPSTQPA